MISQGGPWGSADASGSAADSGVPADEAIEPVLDLALCPCCSGSGVVDNTDMPKWATKVTSVESIYWMLKSNEIDDRAIQ